VSDPGDPPAAIEITLSAGLVVRGQQWPGGADSVILVHEPGRDLDAWRDLPELLRDDGLTVVAIDLPGHGLSDNPWQPACLPEVLSATMDSLSDEHGTALIIAAGPCATVALRSPSPRLGGVVALSPGNTGDSPAAGGSPPRPKLVLAGAADPAVLAAARSVSRQAPGWSLVSTFATREQGTALLECAWAAQVREQIRGFVRDCRFGRSRR
jgi:pimeloyl-ACP methyl ester carboxylesterase